MKTILPSATNSELVQFLRSPARLNTADREAIAARIEEFANSVEPKHARARKRGSSRADRFSEAQSDLSDAKSVMEELRDELQNWLDNMPENLQNGSKADELNEAISELDNMISELEDAEGRDVNFPGMF